MFSDFARPFLVLLAATPAMCAAPRVLLTKPVHLGVPGSPEWAEFARGDNPPQTRLDLAFEAEPNTSEARLFIRQRDVKQEWVVEVNSRRIGKLFLMETGLVQTVPVPAGILKSAGNTLAIFRPGAGLADDIVIEEIALEARAVPDTSGLAMLAVDVSQADGDALPCRLTIVDERGSLAALWRAPKTDREATTVPCAIRPGVIYTPDGHARVAAQPGKYTVIASRGFEWGIARQVVNAEADKAQHISLRLQREVATPNLVACDTHIHTFTFSRHGDATIDERMLTLAGEGIELPIATDHNTHIDYREAMRRTGMERWFTPVIGNEVTTRVGHFNIFPVNEGAPPPDANLTEWPALLEAMRRTPGVRVIILNHPRSIHSGFRPFDPENFNSASGEARKALAFNFDAMEVLNSGAQQTDSMRVYRDWFALLNRGHRIVGVSGSDAHDVSRFIVGQGRTYLAAADNDPAHIDVEGACKNLREGRAFVSMGLLVNLKVNGRFSVGDLVTDEAPELLVEAEVRGPGWVKGPTHVALFANGTQIRETDFADAVSGADSVGGVKGRVAWRISRPRYDIHLVAIATAPAVDEPFWAMTKPYQPNSIEWVGRAIGSTNPVWVDGDGDASFSSAHAYAERVVIAEVPSTTVMLTRLGDYDEAVAVQAASICQSRGMDLSAPEFVNALENAAPAVRNGFMQFLHATKH
jgi:hypothetical protein